MLREVNCQGQKDLEESGFTLVEVLVALAVAAVGFGIILHSVGLQMSLVAGALERHQMLLYSSQVLEVKLSAGYDGTEIKDVPIGFQESAYGEEIEVPEFLYRIQGQPVTADPRVQQVTVTMDGRRSIMRLSAYRLRVLRD